MTANLLTITAIVLFVAGLLWVTSRWGKLNGVARDTYPREFLIGLGRGMGLDRYTERDYFGERVQILSGSFNRLDVEFEISSGEDWQPYVRATIDFPRSLAQDIGVYSGDRRPVGSQVRGLEEVELGDPDFDERFVLFGRDPERVELMLADATRYQLMKMESVVDDLRLSDASIFLFLGDSPDREDIKRILKKAVDLGDRVYKAARMLGPRTPERGAGHYEKATTETEMRVSSVETSVEDRPGAK